MSINIRIQSDFRDYYDHAFASRHDYTDTWLRYCADIVPRSLWFFMLKTVKAPCVPYGTGLPFLNLHTGRRFVVYTDEFSHCGEGKRLVSFDEAVAIATEDPTMLFSVYIEPVTPGVVVSTRELRIGSAIYHLRYTNTTGEWRSNVIPESEQSEDGLTIEVLDGSTAPPRHSEYTHLFASPMLAIDYVWDSVSNQNLAMDVNTSPSWKGTPLEDMLGPSAVYSLIAVWWTLHRPEGLNSKNGCNDWGNFT